MRIQKEYKEIETSLAVGFVCRMLRYNPFTWLFAFRGGRGTDFECGIFHGLIQFSDYYPLEPPSIMLLSENGRFKTKSKIGLNWQPSWTVPDALLALIGSMDSYPDGELGSV
ncbi:ubiquitin-conjugating enzyme E2 32-like [Prunus avium]|uniref:Ubiquitin-conjugating enzyme E2 32-like n=1 Tax=Prunus avium TaxID=42229 RepID=A0A6P5RNK2_PRUAV|nr:ubiquitin-conjugating enzyme E2 32-like [Prunus avium]